VLRIKLKASHMLGKYSATKPQPELCISSFAGYKILETRCYCFFANGDSLKPADLFMGNINKSYNYILLSRKTQS
jgi:hypothetical protein